MIPEYKTLFFTFSIIRCDGDGDLLNVLPNNSESLLDILILDSFVVVVNSGILYKNGILAFLAAATTSRFSSYLILCNRYYSIFYF